MKCSQCGWEFGAQDTFCGMCGWQPPHTNAEDPSTQVQQPTLPKSFCQYCGAPIQPQARFCNNCGKPVGAQVPKPAFSTSSAVNSLATLKQKIQSSSPTSNDLTERCFSSLAVKRFALAFILLLIFAFMHATAYSIEVEYEGLFSNDTKTHEFSIANPDKHGILSDYIEELEDSVYNSYSYVSSSSDGTYIEYYQDGYLHRTRDVTSFRKQQQEAEIHYYGLNIYMISTSLLFSFLTFILIILFLLWPIFNNSLFKRNGSIAVCDTALALTLFFTIISSTISSSLVESSLFLKALESPDYIDIQTHAPFVITLFLSILGAIICHSLAVETRAKRKKRQYH